MEQEKRFSQKIVVVLSREERKWLAQLLVRERIEVQAGSGNKVDAILPFDCAILSNLVIAIEGTGVTAASANLKDKNKLVVKRAPGWFEVHTENLKQNEIEAITLTIKARESDMDCRLNR